LAEILHEPPQNASWVFCGVGSMGSGWFLDGG